MGGVFSSVPPLSFFTMLLMMVGRLPDFFPLLLLAHLVDRPFLFSSLDMGPFLLFLVSPPLSGALS